MMLFIYIVFMNFVLFNKNDFNHKSKILSSFNLPLYLNFFLYFSTSFYSEIALRNFQSEKDLLVARKCNVIDRRRFGEIALRI